MYIYILYIYLKQFPALLETKISHRNAFNCINQQGTVWIIKEVKYLVYSLFLEQTKRTINCALYKKKTQAEAFKVFEVKLLNWPNRLLLFFLLTYSIELQNSGLDMPENSIRYMYYIYMYCLDLIAST